MLQRARPLEKRPSKSSKAKQNNDLEGKVSHNSFDTKIQQIDGFQNFKITWSEFTNSEKQIKKLKTKPEFLENYDQDKWHKFEYYTKRVETTILENSEAARFSNKNFATKNSKFIENSIKEMLATDNFRTESSSESY